MRLRSFFTQSLNLVVLVLAVVAFVEEPLAVVLGGEDVGADAVEEPAVMADDDRRAGKFPCNC